MDVEACMVTTGGGTLQLLPGLSPRGLVLAFLFRIAYKPATLAPFFWMALPRVAFSFVLNLCAAVRGNNPNSIVRVPFIFYIQYLAIPALAAFSNRIKCTLNSP